MVTGNFCNQSCGEWNFGRFYYQQRDTKIGWKSFKTFTYSQKWDCIKACIWRGSTREIKILQLHCISAQKMWDYQIGSVMKLTHEDTTTGGEWEHMPKRNCSKTSPLNFRFTRYTKMKQANVMLCDHREPPPPVPASLLLWYKYSGACEYADFYFLFYLRASFSLKQWCHCQKHQRWNARSCHDCI